MNDLLTRLAPASGASARPDCRRVPLRPLLAQVIAAHRGHLLANAVEASGPADPVTVRVTGHAHEVGIEIADQGAGMDSEFVASRLFAPFASTKEHGFGIGAFEARSLVLGMGGRLAVDSRPGDGTHFTLSLPLAVPAEALERLSA
jgi:signal transduction histidine kinase